MGGTDEPSNLIELTAEEHAEAHRILWEQHGNMKDYYAWQGLASNMGKEEIRLEMCKLGGDLCKDPIAKAKQKKRFAEIGHQQGYRNSQYGTCWVTDGSNNKKIKKTDTIPEGWYRGRV